MAKTKLENLRLGIFVVLGTILLLFAAYLIGNRQNMFSKTFEITAVFKNATGLQNGNNVRFSGINVGTVNGIEMINDTTIQVRMVIQDNMRQHIKKNAIASIGTNGLVGSMLINIIPGLGTSSLISPGDELLSSNKIGTKDMMSTLSITNENAALLTNDLLKISKTLTNGQGTLGRLLNDTIMANDLHKTMVNLKNTSYKANSTIAHLNDIVKQLNFKESVADILFNDTISGEKIKNVIQNLETTTIEIDEMSKNLNLAISEINDGQGAISYLAKDSLFVNKLEKSMENIEQGTERFNENMEALKHNFLTRGYFRKLEKQEKN
ncbi:MlaD family protein [Maribacter confluentis]|uniref:MlaD family protein n=1 Tax=Maribacter confluentis TaxID=1656093 RepID=A0ABT8RTU9_9FLAO|nr:MlaD family protein [Maribacter confluentis]MDO1513942.1 MlaD family protein [Maribacter confluentis]